MDKFSYDYSEYSDILHIHKTGETTKGSVELGDFALDFGKNDEVVGLEIEHASEFFDNVDIGKESLSKVESVQLIIDRKNPQCQVIFLNLKFPTVVKKVPVPLIVAS